MSSKKVLIIVLAASAVLLALGIGSQIARAQAQARIPIRSEAPFASNQEGGSGLSLEYTVQSGTIAGGNYQLTSLCRRVSNTSGNGNYWLENLTGSWLLGDCCCTYFPVIKR